MYLLKHPYISLCRIGTTAPITYFTPIAGALAGLPSNLGSQGPGAGSWHQLGIQAPGAGSWPNIALQGPGALYLPIEFRKEGKSRRCDPSTDTEELEHRLRRKRRERPANQISPAAADERRPPTPGGLDKAVGRSGRRARFCGGRAAFPSRHSRGDRPHHRDPDSHHGQRRDSRHPRTRVGDRDDSPRRAHRRPDSRSRRGFRQRNACLPSSSLGRPRASFQMKE